MDGSDVETQWSTCTNGAQTSPVAALPGECRSRSARDPRSRRPETVRQTGSQSKIGRVWGCPRNCESNDGCVPETVRHSPIELCQMRSARLIAGGRGTVERVRLPVGRGLFAGVHGFDEPGDLPVCVPQSRSGRLLFSPRASGIRGLWRAWLPHLPVSGGVSLLYGRSTPSVHEVARPWYRSGVGLEPPPKPRQR